MQWFLSDWVEWQLEKLGKSEIKAFSLNKKKPKRDKYQVLYLGTQIELHRHRVGRKVEKNFKDFHGCQSQYVTSGMGCPSS